MADEMGEYKEFSELNALGNPSKVINVDAADGGRAGVGPVGNTRPTGIMAEGIDISTGTSVHDKSVRKGMSTTHNENLKRMGSRK